MEPKKISVIGLGYIGLPTAALIAMNRKQVIGVDVCQYVVDSVNAGLLHIVEPDLDLVLKGVVTKGYLRASTHPEPADAFIIAVPTPLKNGNKPDLNCIRAAAESIVPVISKGNLIILESTSPVGTTESMSQWLANARPDLTFPHQLGEHADVQIAYCPERVLPGKVVHELVENKRVIGGMTQAASAMASALYRIFVRGELIATSVRTAEMCKLAENSFRDVNIAFANEISMICDKLDIDARELIALANFHPRVNILQPGAGVGGHCIAVDPWFIVNKTPAEAVLIRTAREVNDNKTQWVLEKIEQTVAKVIADGMDAKKVKIACFGLTYKADVDDLRESPALHIVRELAPHYRERLAVVEPNITRLPGDLIRQDIVKMETEKAIQWANIIIVFIGHNQFKLMANKIKTDVYIIDVAGVVSC